MSKADILAALAVPEGETELGGHKVRIRGLTVDEDEQLLGDGFAKGVVPVCATCILNDDGKPMFTVAELKKLKGGSLKQPFFDIMKLTFPKSDEEAEKNS